MKNKITNFACEILQIFKPQYRPKENNVSVAIRDDEFIFGGKCKQDQPAHTCSLILPFTLRRFKMNYCPPANAI